MRRNLLITTAAAALLAGTALAAAQTGQRTMPGGAAEPQAQGQEQQQQQQQQGQREGQPGARGATSGQREEGKDKAPKQQQGQRDGQPSPRSGTTGQGQREGQREGQQGQPGARDAQSPKQPQQNPQAPAQKGAVEGKGQAGGDNVTLTTEQRTTIRQTVIQANNAPHVTNVNFALTVGTVVPTSVRVVTVPATLVEIHPAWRGYLYFIVGERIIILEPGSKRIVAVLVV
jgi:hypothetical protein